MHSFSFDTEDVLNKPMNPSSLAVALLEYLRPVRKILQEEDQVAVLVLALTERGNEPHRICS